MSGLEILQQSKVQKAYEDNWKLGVFRLFLTREWFNTIQKWTNKKLDEKGKATVNESKFDAYLGLKMAMSIVSFNNTTEYWWSNIFTGHSDFINAMSSASLWGATHMGRGVKWGSQLGKKIYLLGTS